MTEQDAVAVLSELYPPYAQAALAGFVRMLINQGKTPEQVVDYVKAEVGFLEMKQRRKENERNKRSGRD